MNKWFENELSAVNVLIYYKQQKAICVSPNLESLLFCEDFKYGAKILRFALSSGDVLSYFPKPRFIIKLNNNHR